MYILAKSFTNKKGEMFLKIFPRQYPSIETAHAAMQSDYQEELKKRHLDRSDEEAILSSYYIDTTEAAIYECQDYAPNWLTVSVSYNAPHYMTRHYHITKRRPQNVYRD